MRSSQARSQKPSVGCRTCAVPCAFQSLFPLPGCNLAERRFRLQAPRRGKKTESTAMEFRSHRRAEPLCRAGWRRVRARAAMTDGALNARTIRRFPVDVAQLMATPRPPRASYVGGRRGRQFAGCGHRHRRGGGGMPAQGPGLCSWQFRPIRTCRYASGLCCGDLLSGRLVNSLA